MFQPKSELPAPGKPKDGAKDPGKVGAQGASSTGTEAPVTLKPAGDLAPPRTQ
jgi:hypothetical protein